MPRRPMVPCAGRCGTLVEGRGFCPRCADRGKGAPRKSAAKRGYGAAWRKQRDAWLAEHPYCADPFGTHGEAVALASAVDHITAHKGNRALFWDRGNWQSLCASCHSRKTATEDGGFGR